MIFGAAAKITPSLAKQPDRIAEARSLGMARTRRLKEFGQAT